MFFDDVFEVLIGKAKLHGAEDEVDINPVMCLLVEGRVGEGIANVEDVAVNLFLISVETCLVKAWMGAEFRSVC